MGEQKDPIESWWSRFGACCRVCPSVSGPKQSTQQPVLQPAHKLRRNQRQMRF